MHQLEQYQPVPEAVDHWPLPKRKPDVAKDWNALVTDVLARGTNETTADLLVVYSECNPAGNL